MALIYDELGNVVGDDGQPSIDQMQYELAKKGQLPRPLDNVTNHFKSIVTQFNPVMMPKVMQDVGTMGTNIASTIVSPYVDILHNMQAAGATKLHRLAGDEQSALEAEARQRQVTPSGLYREPSLPVVREAEQGLGRTFEASKLPPLGPGSGMPGTAPVSPRPFITPNDLRVLGAEATRVGRQIGEIPTDFVNAQSGLQRIDPVTGQPVLGARIQGGVDRLGDIMEQRRMQGLTPIPGLPAALQPQTAMYAVRPAGTRLTTPTIPETARGFSPVIDPINNMFREVTGLEPEQSEAYPTLVHSLNKRIQFGNAPSERNANSAFRSFLENKAIEMYPEAANPSEALYIFNAMHYDAKSRHIVENKLFDEFIQTPEGRQVMPNAANSEEIAKRHDAAAEGLKNMWGKYLVKNLGTEGNPLVKMAAEKGLTFLPAEDVMNIANDEAYAASFNRQKAGMPVQGSFAEPITNLRQEIEAINLPLQNAANAQQALGHAASMAGKDPATVPEFLEARSTAEKLKKEKDKLQKKLDNLTLASAYEAIEDAAVKPTSAKDLLKEIPSVERPFYPSLKESAARDETSYKTSTDALEYSGFTKAADNFYNDVLQGKIPADKAATYPVDKYIRENAEARIKIEQAEKAQIAKHKNDVMKSLKESADALPADKKFGNVGVVELTKDTPLDIANKEVAASTEALDICIGEGGSGNGTRNLFTGKKDPRYTPIVNLLTGEPNPNATRSTSGWVSELSRGEQLPMIRDLETGMPVAAFQFMRSSSVGANGQPQFHIGYASGAGNGRIETKYVNGVRDYLNSRADDITGIGSNLENNSGIYDTKNPSSLHKARRTAQVSENEMKSIDWGSMPRFMTAEDIKQAVKSNVPAPVVTPQTSAFQPADLEQLRTNLTDRVDAVVDDAVLNSNLDVPENLEDRLHAIFSHMQQEYFPTFFDDPIPTMNRSLDYLRNQIDRRANNASELAQEVLHALDNYAAELEAARDDLVRQQQQAVQQPAPQTQTITEETLRNALVQPRDLARTDDHIMFYRDDVNRIMNDVFNSDEFRANPQRTIHNIREQLLDRLMHLEELDDVELRDFGITDSAQRDLITDQINNAVDRLNNLEESLQRAPAPQMQPIEQLRHLAEPRLFAGNSRVVNEALQEYSGRLQNYMANQFRNGMNPVEIADNIATKINEYRNDVLRGPTINTQNFTPNEVSEYAQELRQMIDSLGQWLGEQQQPEPQQANLPTEIQQNINQRNQHITDAYETALTPNTNMPAVDEALSEFADVLGNMATNMYVTGYNFNEIAENLAARVHSEHMALVSPDRINARNLTPVEADIIRQRLNDAYGNLNTIREMNATAPEPMVELNFEPDETHPANQPYPMQSAVNMARELFEQERTDANHFHIPSIEDSIHALEAGVFDDERIRQLPDQQRRSFTQDVAFRLRSMLDDLRTRQTQPMNLNTAYNTAEQILNEVLEDMGSDQSFADLDDQTRNILIDEQQRTVTDRLRGLSDDDILHVLRRLRENNPIPHVDNQPRYTFNDLFNENTQPTPVPAQPNVAPYRPIPDNLIGRSSYDIAHNMSAHDVNQTSQVVDEITDVNSPEEIQNIIGLVRTHPMGPWENFSNEQRGLLAAFLEAYVQNNTPPDISTITDRDRGLYEELNAQLDNAIQEGYPLPDLGDNEAVARLVLNNEVGGEIENAVRADRLRLAEIVRRYGVHGTLPPEGHKDGGRIRKYQDGGSVKSDAAFGIYPGMGKRSQKSDIGDKLNASLIPQDAFDLATTIAPFGKVGKVLAAGILAGDPAEAHAGNMSSLLKLVAREAPEQFLSIRNALYRTFHTGLEHSVVGSTNMGGPSEVMQGTYYGVTPNKLNVKAALKNIDQSPLIDFHTHPSQNTPVLNAPYKTYSEFMSRPSDADLKYWMGQYGSSYTPQWSNEARVMVGTPANKGERTTGAYNFFATDQPAKTLNPATYEVAKHELQRSKPLQSIKDNPVVGSYLDAGGDIGDLLDSASPLLLQKYFAEKGLGRHEMQLSNRPVTSPSVTEQELFNQIANPAIEVLRSKRLESFAEGGTVLKKPSTDQMKHELMMRRK